MNKKLLALAMIGLASQAQAVTTMQLGSGGTLTNLQSSTGSNTSTLVWGLLVDTDGNGFLSNYRAGFPISDTVALASGRFLTTSTGATSGDRLFISANLMATGGSTDGSTGLAKPTNINLSYAAEGATGVLPAGGQAVAIMWFDYTTKTGQISQEGDNFGLFTLPFNTPADLAGGSLAFGQNFIGVDPVRTASIELLPIPEPSAALLGAIGALGLLRRRRN